LDAQNDPANVKVQLFGTVSGDGGAHYLPPVQIAQGQSDARQTDVNARGTTTGGNTGITLNDSAQNLDWVPDNYWAKNFKVVIPSTGEEHTIKASTATQLVLDPADPFNVIPLIGTGYEIRDLSPPGRGNTYNFDYGEYTGLAFYNGVFDPVWPGNSYDLQNPNALGILDLYTAAGTVTHTDAPQSQRTPTTSGFVRASVPAFVMALDAFVKANAFGVPRNVGVASGSLEDGGSVAGLHADLTRDLLGVAAQPTVPNPVASAGFLLLVTSTVVEINPDQGFFAGRLYATPLQAAERNFDIPITIPETNSLFAAWGDTGLDATQLLPEPL
jgi:hypothetical protein